MTRVAGKVAIVTGGAGGIGRAIARRLARNGATVVLTDLREDDGRRAVAELAAEGITASFVAHDVTREEDWERVTRHVVDAHGQLDILVNNAGVSASVGQPFDEIPLDEWKRVMSVNLDGAFLGTRAAVRAMKQGGGGSIVNIGSIAGLVGTRGGAAYGASKGGVHALTRQAAYSCGKHGYNVRVNSILPSYVWTDLIAAKAIREFGSKEDAIAALAARTLLGRLNEPDDVASAVLFLASDESRQITGIELVLDGGQLLR